MYSFIKSGIYLLFVFSIAIGYAQEKEVNLEEAKIEEYTLPELLTFINGEKVSSIKDWEEGRREEILEAFKNEIFGLVPKTKGIKIKSSIIEQGEAYDGAAIRKQVRITIKKKGEELPVNVLVYLPQGVENPPVIFGYNYYGNQSITLDKNVVLSDAWVANKEEFNISENKATEASRGKRGYRWAIEMMLEQGFGLATVYYGELDPDRDDFSDGVHPFFYEKGQTNPKTNEWGAIGAWAWGASRVLDYLIKDPDTRNSKFIMFGHSRLGKTSLWAGAQDPRFDMVISNDSGCGGAAISRRKFGETIAIINTTFPHWFSDTFNQYSHNEDLLPIDQHMLIALVAPRPVYIGSAEDDLWADPKGEYLSGYHAGDVYALYNLPVLSSMDPPAVNHPLHETIIGYHKRTGKHDVMDYDWEQYLAFAKKWLIK